ncbi:MAG TPA: LysE family translocator [Candidatus Dormibacteraeota bacterium]
MDTHQIPVAAFLLFATAMAITPGPGNIVLAATAASLGLVRALPALLGQTIGMSAMLFAVALGVAGVLVHNPVALIALRVCGISVLLWLAWRLARAAPAGEHAAGIRYGFWRAAGFQLVNPKAWLVAAAAAGGYLPASARAPVLSAALLAGLFMVAAVPSCFVWVAAGGGVQRLLRSARAVRVFNLGMAAGLLASIVLLLT